MHIWLALRRLLPLLAVLGLALTPVAAPAATAGMHAAMDHAVMNHAGLDHADMADMDDMPCCPKAEAEAAASDRSVPDCGKGCPLMALCLATVASVLPSAVAIPVPAAGRASPVRPEPSRFASILRAPLPEPPRA